MRVHIDVRDPAHARLQQRRNGQRGIVVHAEPRRVIGHGVMQAAAEIHRTGHLAAGDAQGSRHRSPDDPRRVLVHARRDRGVHGAKPVPDREPETRLRRAAHGVDVPHRVHGRQRVHVREFRRDDVETVDDAKGLREQPGQLPPQRVQRMVTAQVVPEHPPIPHQ